MENNDFSSGFFPIPERFWEDYQERRRAGLQRMRETDVAIGGLARDIAEIIPQSIARIERLGELFRSYSVVIYENDSQDDTKRILANWADRNPRVHFLHERLGAPSNRKRRCLNRTLRMAHYRNEIRRYITKQLSHCQYTIVLDFDLAGGWSLDGIMNSFGWSDWDFMGSYGVYVKPRRFSLLRRAIGMLPYDRVHYDAWAFRLANSPEMVPIAATNHLYWDNGSPPVRVFSCFGGLGIYRSEAMKLCKYDGSDTEHVRFHNRMHEAGLDRLYLNPSQIVLYNEVPKRLVQDYSKRAANLTAVPSSSRNNLLIPDFFSRQILKQRVMQLY